MSLKYRIQLGLAKVAQREYDRAYASAHSGEGQRAVHVLFTSVARAQLGGNMEFVYEAMKRRGWLDGDGDHPVTVDFDLREKLDYARDVSALLPFVRKAAQADVIFTDDNHPYLNLIRFKPEVRVVQLWHAVGAFKKVGFSRDRADAAEHARTSLAHRCYTHVIVSAECDRPHYAEAFRQPVERVHATGVPRIDGFLDPVFHREAKDAFLARYPQAAGKRVILFSPTFRGDVITASTYDFSRLDLVEIARWCRAHDAVFVLKWHPYIHGAPPVPGGCGDVLLDAAAIREVNDILPAADAVVTDYSSVIYEASLLLLPLVFFAYDLDEYLAGRGFYEPFSEYACGPVVRTQDELLAVLEDARPDVSAVERFRHRHFAHLDRHASDRVVDLVLG